MLSRVSTGFLWRGGDTIIVRVLKGKLPFFYFVTFGTSR
jgi:hypothetical protein